MTTRLRSNDDRLYCPPEPPRPAPPSTSTSTSTSAAPSEENAASSHDPREEFLCVDGPAAADHFRLHQATPLERAERYALRGESAQGAPDSLDARPAGRSDIDRAAIAQLEALAKRPAPGGRKPDLHAITQALSSPKHSTAPLRELEAQVRVLSRLSLTPDDVKLFAAIGYLPDVAGADGKPVSGQTRLDRLVADAKTRGDWPTVNAVTLLFRARRAALEATGDAAGGAAVGRALQQIFADASAARAQEAAKTLARAEGLEATAEKARKARDPANADALEAQAVELRLRAADEADREAAYRSSQPGAGFGIEHLRALAARARGPLVVVE